jgi:hypothetical protein
MIPDLLSLDHEVSPPQFIIRYGVVANIARSHRAAQGSIPCTGGILFLPPFPPATRSEVQPNVQVGALSIFLFLFCFFCPHVYPAPADRLTATPKNLLCNGCSLRAFMYSIVSQSIVLHIILLFTWDWGYIRSGENGLQSSYSATCISSRSDPDLSFPRH